MSLCELKILSCIIQDHKTVVTNIQGGTGMSTAEKNTLINLLEIMEELNYLPGQNNLMTLLDYGKRKSMVNITDGEFKDYLKYESLQRFGSIAKDKDIRDAMERQMRAEREKREKILLAEGQKQSAILIAEGNKEALIKNAEADKQAQILSAEGKAQSMREIKKAEADGIRVLRDAEAAGIVAIREAKADEAVLKMKYYEALATVANGKATKIFIPNNLAGISSIASVAKESLTDIQEKE